jgi:hypothetical protein
MARRKNRPEAVREKSALAERLRLVRVEFFGERGGSEMARRLALPVRTWYNYESGVTVPAEVILRFMELTGVEPQWLLHGHGPRYRGGAPAATGPAAPAEPGSIRDLLRVALQRLEQREATAPAPEPGRSPKPSLRATRPLSSPPTVVGPAPGPSTHVVQVEGDDMAPVLADGAQVAYEDREEPLADLAGGLVVAQVGSQLLIRWLELSGTYAILRAEHPDVAPILINLQNQAHAIRRVLSLSTPH